MDNETQDNQPCWKLMLARVGFVAIACAMWLSTFCLLFCGNESGLLTTKFGEFSIATLRVPGSGGLFH